MLNPKPKKRPTYVTRLHLSSMNRGEESQNVARRGTSYWWNLNSGKFPGLYRLVSPLLMFCTVKYHLYFCFVPSSITFTFVLYRLVSPLQIPSLRVAPLAPTQHQAKLADWHQTCHTCVTQGDTRSGIKQQGFGCDTDSACLTIIKQQGFGCDTDSACLTICY